MTFEQHVNGIEDAMLASLEAKMTGVRNFGVYAGQLDNLTEKDLKTLLGQMKEDFPLVLVGYTDGKDDENPATGRSPGCSLAFRHECSFIVFCLASNPRGAVAQKRGVSTTETGVVKMISEVREALSGIQFLRAPDGTLSVLTQRLREDDPREVLNSPLLPKGNEHIAKMPGITVMAVIFDTDFRWSSEDRTAAGTAVEEIILKIDVTNERGQSQNGKPGVTIS